jgi:dimethylhistidine N-methyltransferase
MPDDGSHSFRTLRTQAANAVTEAALAGLRAVPKTLPPKLFYDDEGCRLFQRITQLPEYYPTRAEFRMLERVAPSVAAMSAAGTILVEYGASDEAKALYLLRELDAADRKIFTTYIPIDLGRSALWQACARLDQMRPDLALYPIVADFTQPLVLPELDHNPRLGFFPGSTIGNFVPAEARAFLSQVRSTLGSGARLLVGVDMRKDATILREAYDDSQGVTAAFNLNLLGRLNREAGADFDLESFRHQAVWNDTESRIEMHLRSLRDQSVRVGDDRIWFSEGETIHTENSYKWTLDGFDRLVRRAGWRTLRVWVEEPELYSMHLLEAGDIDH